MPTREGLENKKEAVGIISKVFILHGWGYSTEKWNPFLKLLEEKGLKPQLLEIPGLTAPIDRPWTLDNYVEWLKSKLGKEKVILLGHSNGGRISIAFALKYPELVGRLVLIDSAGVYHGELPIKLKRAIFGNIAKVGKKITTSQVVREALYKLARVSDYKDASPEMRETMASLISVDLTPELNRITSPTLIIWGAEDKTTPLSDGKLMHKLIPGSQIYVVEGARHSPQFTHPNEVCAKLIEMINGDL